MRPSYRFPKAWGRMGRAGYAKPVEDLPPIGGDIYLVPETDGLNGWSGTHTVTHGNVYVRLVYRCNKDAMPELSVKVGGQELPLLADAQGNPNDWGGWAPPRSFCTSQIFGGVGIPLGEQLVEITCDQPAGEAIIRVGELRQAQSDSPGAWSGYCSDGRATGCAFGFYGEFKPEPLPGHEWAGVFGMSVPIGFKPRPVSLDMTAPDYYHDKSWAVVEMDNAAGNRTTIAVFAAGPVKSINVPVMMKWQGTTPAAGFAGAMVELKNTAP